MNIRNTLKHCLPYPITCAIARMVNRPFLEDIHRCERIVEYAWVIRNLRVGRLLDFGCAGSYFTEMLCQFGDVVGCDPRRTPVIAHPRLSYEWPLQSIGFDTILAVSVLEHHLPADEIVKDLLWRLHPKGQLMITVPTSATPLTFHGYRTFTQQDFQRWMLFGQERPCHLGGTFFRRTDRGWEMLNAAGHESLLNEQLPDSTEHQVNAVACVRLVKP